MPPWTPSDAPSHQKLARSPKEQRQWSDVANKVLKETHDEGRAIREANSVVHRSHTDASSVGGVPRRPLKPEPGSMGDGSDAGM